MSVHFWETSHLVYWCPLTSVYTEFSEVIILHYSVCVRECMHVYRRYKCVTKLQKRCTLFIISWYSFCFINYELSSGSL